MSATVTIAPNRIAPWFSGFEARNGTVVALEHVDGATRVRTERDALAVVNRECTATTLAELISGLTPDGSAYVVLIRRGGYALARATFHGTSHEVESSKVGTRYVQGRTAAGGQSQQRFARRRAGQAQALVSAATQVARDQFGENPRTADLLITGGDGALLETLLGHAPLSRLPAMPRVHVEVGDPRRRTIDEAIDAARSVQITVTNAPPARSEAPAID